MELNAEGTLAPPQAPQWLIDMCGGPVPHTEPNTTPLPENIDRDRAIRRVSEYLENEAPTAIEGAGGDTVTYAVCARVKDFGVSQIDALELLQGWNERCEPPWNDDELAKKIENAWKYGTEAPGAAAPEVEFDAVPDTQSDVVDTTGSPVLALNNQYALVQVGGGHRVLWETTNHVGQSSLVHLTEPTFHRLLSADVMLVGAKQKKISELWVSHPQRRTFSKGMLFWPGRTAPEDYYNLWRGWSVEPTAVGEVVPTEWQDAVDKWQRHLFENIVSGDQAHYEWVMSWFASIVQSPGRCPPVALVLRGGKGVGKNMLFGPVAKLLGEYAMLASDKRYIVSNFNAHLERCLLLILDEAFWSGDKGAEGQLKNLISGDEHVIERKGQENFKVDNLTRVGILGNEDWIVPASADERRYAVFDVGDGRKQDVAYFGAMARGMESGGHRLLLRVLLDWKRPAHVNLNVPPQTSGLSDQKMESLDPVAQWWFGCLDEERIIGGDFDGWPPAVRSDRLRECFTRWAREQNIKLHRMTARKFGATLAKNGAKLKREREMAGGARFYQYRIPDIEACRGAFSDATGVRFET